MGAPVTPGQKCLLDLLQRKLLSTIQAYSKLSRENQQSDASKQEEIELELRKLRDKIRRISARQKRFTLEIINGNGNNTIPKETFFQALGLITKEALSKLNSKSNERRRRTTANPRFSHEAIQAKRALEPLHKRQIDQRTRDGKRDASRRPQRTNNSSNTSNTTTSSINQTGNNANNNNNNNNSNNFDATNQQASNESSQNIKFSSNPASLSSGNISTNTSKKIHPCSTTANNQPNTISNKNITANNNGRANNNNTNTAHSNPKYINNGEHRRQHHHHNEETSNHALLQKERNELLNQYGILQMHINKRVNEIVDKRENNRHLEKQIELMRKRGLDLVTAIHLIDPTVELLDDAQLISNPSAAKLDQTTTSNEVRQKSKIGFHDEKRGEKLAKGEGVGGYEASQFSNAEPLDIYIDMKCDESLDGLD